MFFELYLPLTNWTGKFVQMGSGGHGGFVIPSFCTSALERRHACLMSDTGHQGGALEGMWADANLQAKIDWGYRAAHVATVAGKAITARFYNRAIERSYFMGCSTGGRQALQEAQRFPWDYDGIVAGAPPIRLSDLYITFAWGQRAARRPNGEAILGLPQLKSLTDGALAACDKSDGLQDGIIGNPRQCPFRPRQLLCKPGATNKCLTSEQVLAAERIYSGPVDQNGSPLFGGGAPPGTELGTSADEPQGGNWGIYYSGNAAEQAQYAGIANSGLRYVFRDTAMKPGWTIDDFDFAEDYKRVDVMQSIYDSSNPDLSRFKNAGGKLLIYHGLNDLSILPHWVTEYYRKVEAIMGGPEETRTFARLFHLPGVQHCAGGPGADVVDVLTAMEKWVERGEAPDRLIAYHLRADAKRAFPPVFPVDPQSVAFSRPVFPYPAEARYSGKGNVNSFESFRRYLPAGGRPASH